MRSTAGTRRRDQGSGDRVLITDWAAKRSIIARLSAQAEGGTLDGVQVAYSLPPEPERQCVYGGRVRSVREQMTAEHSTQLFRSTTTVEIRVRVVELGDDVEEVDRTAEGICNAVAVAILAEPRIAGPGSQVGVTALDADPTAISPGPEPTVVANVGMIVTLVLPVRP
jgi:hypothetical protein